jgi:hypothetical protein
MPLGERFRSGGARGIARFLAEHERCDAGFDVHRDEGLGSGKLRIACLGCGETIDYRAAEAGELAAAGMTLTPAEANGGTAPPPVAPLPPRQPPGPPRGEPFAGRLPPRPRRASPRRRIPRWLSTGLILALILGGVTMIGVGLLRDDNEQQTTTTTSGSGGSTTEKPSTTRAEKPSNTPSATTPQQVPKQPQQQSKQGTSQQQSAPAGAAGTQLQTRRIADRFTIGVPPAWERGTENGAITLTAPGATAEIDVFFESGPRPPNDLAAAARSFLAQRHDGARLRDPEPYRLGPVRALRIRTTYPGGAEFAVVVSARGYSYLVLRRVDLGATDDLEAQADTALASFRPG